MKKKWIWIALGALVLVVIVGMSMARNAKGRVQAVQMAKVRRESVTSRVRAPGKIEAKTQVKISADIMGKVVVLNVKEGDPVKKGQLLLQLDDTQYRSAHAQAVAALSSAKARVREAESALRVSDANYTRQKALFEQKLLSQAEWDAATNAHEGARVALATAQEEVTRSSAAAVGAADNLAKCRFVAPFDGVLSALNVEKGEIVITGTMNNPGTQIMTVSDLSRMLVRAEVDETGRRRHEARPEGEDLGGRVPGHDVQRHRDRDRQHREALGDLHGRGADELRGEGGVRLQRTRGPARDDGRRGHRDRDARADARGADPGGDHPHPEPARPRRPRQDGDRRPQGRRGAAQGEQEQGRGVRGR
jgi:multidrug efflux pump subunit AcrA (membrane-fusion protein)